MKLKSLFLPIVIGAMLLFVGCDQNNNNNKANTPAVESGEDSNIMDLPEVIATVNGVDILKSDYMDAYTQMKVSYESAEVDYASEEGLAFLKTIKDSAINSLIQKEVLNQATLEAGIEITEAEVLAEIESIKSQYATVEEFQTTLAQNNLTEEKLLPLFKSEMAMDAYLRSQIEAVIVTDAEALKQFESYITQLKETGTTDIPTYDEVKEPFKAQVVKNIEQEQMLKVLTNLVEQSDVVIHI